MADAHTPITSSSRLQSPRNHRIYSTSRVVPTEYPLPEIGQTIGGWVPSASLKDNIICEVSEKPQGSQKVVSIQHTALPSIAWTTKSVPSWNENNPIYTSQILIPKSESYPIPNEWVKISSVSYLNSALTGHGDDTIIHVAETPAYGGVHLTVQHMVITPITTSSRLQSPRNHRLYSTTIDVPTGTTLPSVGATITATFPGLFPVGSPYLTNLIYDASTQPLTTHDRISIAHTALPSIAWTTTGYLPQPKGHPVRTTFIVIPNDAVNYPIPVEGDKISTYAYLTTAMGTTYADNVISKVGQQEAYGGWMLSIQHLACPIGKSTIYTTEAVPFPAIYPNDTAFFPGGSNARERNVVAKVEYEYTTNPTIAPTNWLEDDVLWNFNPATEPMTGPFEVKSVIAEAASTNFVAEDGESGMVGDYLNLNFVRQNTINDAITIYAPGTLSYEIGASIPSATQYAEWVASKKWIMISRTVHSFFDWFYLRRTVWVRAQ